MSYNFKNLVFEGGGVKGIAYGGALEILAQKGILANIERVAGTSAGAITAGLLAVGYTDQEIKGILVKTSFNTFKDSPFGWWIGDALSIKNQYGLYEGKAFQNWFEGLVAANTGNKAITFGQLADKAKTSGGRKYRLLYVFGTDLNKGTSVAFNAEKTPEMSIADAVRISMSIPLFFIAVQKVNTTYVDGGVYYNYPINIFDKDEYIVPEDLKSVIPIPSDSDGVYNKETLGLRVDKSMVGHAQMVSNLGDYLSVMLGGVLDNLNKIHLEKQDWHRTVYIDTFGVSATDFSLDQQTIQKLIRSGMDCTAKYFSWFDNPPVDDMPINK